MRQREPFEDHPSYRNPSIFMPTPLPAVGDSKRQPAQQSTPRASLPQRMLRGLMGFGLAACLSSCSLLSNFNVLSVEQDVSMGLQAYEEAIGQERVISSGAQAQLVTDIMNRLVAAARVENPELVDMFPWEVRLLDNDQVVNAFCLPGGKMAVYTGILPIAQSETGLAVVMGHEIAHALERHGTEAVSRQMGAGLILQILTGGEPGQMAQLAANLTNLSFGRRAELEADRSGLRYMARAGYNPEEAVGFWQRMAEGAGPSPPEWLSTHPSNANRIEQIQELLPEAMELYRQSGGPSSPGPGGKETNSGKWGP